jgi:hypothetical protein
MDVIGLVNVTLSVTNSYGLKAITSKVVKVLNAGNTFPCQTSVTMLNEATCGQNDGRIRINNYWRRIGIFCSAIMREMKLLQPMAMNTITLPKAIIL